MCKRLADASKVGLADTPAQIIGCQQRIHDVQKLDWKAPVGPTTCIPATQSTALSMTCKTRVHEVFAPLPAGLQKDAK